MIRKYWKLLFIAAILLFAMCGYLNYFTFENWGIGCEPEPWPEIIVDNWTKPLTEAGYKPAQPVKPDHIPSDKTPPAGEIILHGSGTVAETAEQVEIVAVQTPDGQRWLSGWVDGKQVTWQRLDWVLSPAHDDRSDFSLTLSAAAIDGADFGAGLHWHPVRLMGWDIGPAVTLDINRDLGLQPDWAAVTGRVSRPVLGPVSVEAGAGYRFGQDAGLHLEAGLGLAIGL
jgi:hypothetical protein